MPGAVRDTENLLKFLLIQFGIYQLACIAQCPESQHLMNVHVCMDKYHINNIKETDVNAQAGFSKLCLLFIRK